MFIMQNTGPSRVQCPFGFHLVSKPNPKKIGDIRSQSAMRETERGGGWGGCLEEILGCKNVVVRKCSRLMKVLELAVKWEVPARHFTLDPTGAFFFSLSLLVLFFCKFECKSPRLN